ncbi:hypothetical protein M2401_002827 [Pseudomonas sp. JUb42]|jgi:hypothetical protein|nr:hypothetical protein [Pseudomonas sp. JUb42]
MCGSGFIREEVATFTISVTDSLYSRMNMLSSNDVQVTESQRLCGSELIRESGVPGDEDASNVPASSRMNSLPQIFSLPRLVFAA